MYTCDHTQVRFDKKKTNKWQHTQTSKHDAADHWLCLLAESAAAGVLSLPAVLTDWQITNTQTDRQSTQQKHKTTNQQSSLHTWNELLI